MLRRARRPIVMTGGGAWQAAESLTAIAERLGAVVVASNAGKGIVPDDHALGLGASTVRPEVQAFIAEADCILAVGTELSETDSFVERLDFRGSLIRVDIDVYVVVDKGIRVAVGRAFPVLNAGHHRPIRRRAGAGIDDPNYITVNIAVVAGQQMNAA